MKKAIYTLIIGTVLLLGAVEILTRFVVIPSGRIERRIRNEYRSLMQPPSGESHPLAFVGNSTLLNGVDFPAVHAGLDPQWDARRFVVEATSYYDWYYGLRRLFDEGLRCDAVAVSLSPRYLVSPLFRGNYFARRLMLARDFYAVAQETHLHPTQAADLLFSHFSEFYGLRAELRAQLLSRLFPSVGLFTARLNAAPYPPLTPEILQAAAPRLRALRDLASAHHARLILVILPLRDSGDGSQAVLDAAGALGVPVVRPIESGSLDSSYFNDDAHLTPEGARLLTPMLIEDLKRRMNGEMR